MDNQKTVSFRVERDPLGDFEVPADAYYGVQTARARANFPISGLTAPDSLIRATIFIKRAAAEANGTLGRLDPRIAEAIIAAADEVLAGHLRDQFIVDVYQAGAGTSHNMNANEVLANRAAEMLGGSRGTYDRVHPNDHVNMSQSTNDVYPTATRVSLAMEHPRLASACRRLADAFDAKATDCADVLKVGRTHLQDAVPITLGQEFGGYAACLRTAADAADESARALCEVNLGATAVGTGLNAGDDYVGLAVEALARLTRLPLRPATNRFRVTQSMGDVVAYSGALRRLAVEVSKIASDLRLLSMGPRAGIAEIRLPPVQPGSSIMPGKVNPSVPEMVNQVSYQVYGCDTTVMAAGDAGQLELNVMMPVMAWNALHAQRIMTNALDALRERTIENLEADADRSRELLDRSTAVATALSPYIGYAATAEIAKAAVASGRPIRDLVLERGLIDAARLDQILSAEAMTRPGLAGEPIEGKRPKAEGKRPKAEGKRPKAEGKRPKAEGKRQKAKGRRQKVVLGVLLALALIANLGAQGRQARPQPHGRLFPPQDLGLLEAPDRDIWQRPDQIMDALAIAEAAVVADIGAGAGWFTIRLARRVGPNGIVYAEDVQSEAVTAISRRVTAEGLSNVKPVLGQIGDPKLPAASLHAALIVDAYHESEERVPLLRNLAKSLRRDGRIGVVDFKLEGGGPGPPSDERVSPEVVIHEAKSAGLRLLSQETFLQFQYFLIFGLDPKTTAKDAGKNPRD